MPPTILVVDDLRAFHALEALYARTSAEAIRALEELAAAGASLDALWLDYDLGLRDDASTDDVLAVVDWLQERAAHGRTLPVTEAVVHTSDPVGAQAVERALHRFYRVRRVNAESAGATLPEPAKTVQHWGDGPYPGDTYERAAEALSDAVEDPLTAQEEHPGQHIAALRTAWRRFADAFSQRSQKRRQRASPKATHL